MSTDAAERRTPDQVPDDFNPWQPYTRDDAPALPPSPPGGAGQPAAPRPTRRRTGLLMAAALLLGVVGGGGAGYAVQAGRAPTPLPPLVAPTPRYPARPLDAKAAAAAAPAPLAIDGDLRKLLLSRPKGARSWDFLSGEDGWMPPDQMALIWGDSGEVFRSLLTSGFRRAAVTTWKEGATNVRIRLIQYRSDSSASVASAMKEADDCGRFAESPCSSKAIPGTASGIAYATQRNQPYADSRQRFYHGVAVARRGDVVMRIDLYSPKRVDLRRVLDLAEHQWGRL